MTGKVEAASPGVLTWEDNERLADTNARASLLSFRHPLTAVTLLPAVVFSMRFLSPQDRHYVLVAPTNVNEINDTFPPTRSSQASSAHRIVALLLPARSPSVAPLGSSAARPHTTASG